MDFQLDPAQLGFEFQTGRLQNLFVRMSKPPSGQQSTKILLCSKYFKPLILLEEANLVSLLFHIMFFSSMQQLTTEMHLSLEVASIIKTKCRLIKQAIEMYS